MEFHIAKEELVRALQRVQGIVERRSTNPIIANVLLRAESAGLVVTATDTEISFVGTYEAQVTTEGEITIEAKHLFDIARNLPTQEVSVQSAEDVPMEVEIRSGRAYFRVKGMAAESFPPVPGMAGESAMQITSGELRRVIERTAFSISSDDTRTGLNGASLEAVDDTRLRLVATDGHRLSLAEVVFQGELAGGQSVLLPRKGLGELRKLCDDSDDAYDIAFVQNQAVFHRGNVTLAMRLLEGVFPDYRQVIPSQPTRAVIVERRALIDGLKRASILAPERSNAVRFTIGDQLLGLQSNHSEFGSASEELEVETDGEPLEIGFNARYFLDALAVIADERVKLEFGDSLGPCLLKPAADTPAMFVIMPMRLD